MPNVSSFEQLIRRLHEQKCGVSSDAETAISTKTTTTTTTTKLDPVKRPSPTIITVHQSNDHRTDSISSPTVRKDSTTLTPFTTTNPITIPTRMAATLFWTKGVAYF